MNQVDTYNEKQLRRIVRTNRLILRLSGHWLTVALIFLFVYTGLAFTAPILMETGFTGAANVLYKLYSPLCHQFAFRSWFLFGDQVAYPRAASGSSLKSFESYASQDPHFAGVNLYQWSTELELSARSFKGDPQMGYKTALCERDVAIYGSMLLAGLLFTRVRRWLRPAPIWLYLMLGLMPIGLDGFSQMFGYPPFQFWPARETLPGFRLLTGALFGIMNIWLAFPYLEMSMRDAVDAIGEKLEAAEQMLLAMQSGN